MRIGDLNKRITLQYQTNIPDGMGGFTTSWVDHATIWAAIWPVSATEGIKIRIRYRTIFKSFWRFKFGNRYFAIVSILNPSEKNHLLDLMCKEAA